MDSTHSSGSTKPKNALQEFYQNLDQMGAGADLVKERGSEILNILKSQDIANSGQVDGAAISSDSSTANQSQLPAVSNFSCYRNFIC